MQCLTHHTYISTGLNRLEAIIVYLFCAHAITTTVEITLPMGYTMGILNRNLVVPVWAKGPVFVESAMQNSLKHYELINSLKHYELIFFMEAC